MKRRKVDPKFPCSCGHIKKSHYEVGAPIWEEWCTGKQEGKVRSKLCDCIKYVSDNLKYLEQQSKKKRGKH